MSEVIDTGKRGKVHEMIKMEGLVNEKEKESEGEEGKGCKGSEEDKGKGR